MKKDTTKKPFFAKLLEEQELAQVSGGQTTLPPIVTKPPYDTTMKYPSDNRDEENGSAI